MPTRRLVTGNDTHGKSGALYAEPCVMSFVMLSPAQK
jgi:hypothetical protein